MKFDSDAGFIIKQTQTTMRVLEKMAGQEESVSYTDNN
jgi:hypothetical protein